MDIKDINRQPLVIKLSSLAVTNESGAIAHYRLNQILTDIVSLIETHGIRPVIVSSGAINIGRSILGHGAEDMAYLQAAAAFLNLGNNGVCCAGCTQWKLFRQL